MDLDKRPIGRPNKQIVLQSVDENGSTIDVLRVSGIWIVAYQNQPVGLRRTYRFDINKRYPRTGYNNPAHAYAMANKLNHLFDTDEFTVISVGDSLDDL
jgi:hypothetical protein